MDIKGIKISNAFRSGLKMFYSEVGESEYRKEAGDAAREKFVVKSQDKWIHNKYEEEAPNFAYLLLCEYHLALGSI